jgi:hypothetical protein
MKPYCVAEKQSHHEEILETGKSSYHFQVFVRVKLAWLGGLEVMALAPRPHRKLQGYIVVVGLREQKIYVQS